MLRLTIICLLIIVCAKDTTCKKLRQENSALQSDEDPSGKRTLMIGKLVLLPILAGVGIKFLVLLPIVLSKIALLGILSFVSSNLSLLVSAVMGVRSYFFEDKPAEEDQDYDSRYKSRYESHKSNTYDSHDPHDDHRYYEDNHDPNDKYMNRYKGYESSHPGYNSYHSDHDDYKPSKKRFRPFKLLGRIKDVIKNHFHKSGDHEKKYRQYDNDYKNHLHDPSEDHNEYSHTIRETKYKDSDHLISSHQSGLKSKYYEGYRVPQDWSHKNEVMSNHALKGGTNQDPVISVSSGQLGEQLKPAVEDPSKELMRGSSITGYKVYENNPKFKEPFIVFGVPQSGDSDLPAAFYTTDYKITDFQTVPQADTSK